MSDKGKSDRQIENEERFRVAAENARGHDEEVRSEAYKRVLERRSEIFRSYRADFANAEQSAARAGHSDRRRQRDSDNRSRAYRAARDDDERLGFLVFNRTSYQYRERVREGCERRIRERDERVECDHKRDAVEQMRK